MQEREYITTHQMLDIFMQVFDKPEEEFDAELDRLRAEHVQAKAQETGSKK